MRMSFYAVRVGRKPGIYQSWAACLEQINKYPNAAFKKFSTLNQATEFCNQTNTQNQNTAATVEPIVNGNTTENDNRKSRKRSRREALTTVEASSSSQLSEPIETITLMHDAKCLDRVVVFTDGSCKTLAGVSRAGIGVFWGENHPWNVSARWKGVQANNRAEIGAACCAIARAKSGGIRRLLLCTDSQFLINCATDWGPRWRQNGWRLSNGGDVNVRQSVEKLLGLLDDGAIQVEWRHVPSHVGIAGNEAADRLASAGTELSLD